MARKARKPGPEPKAQGNDTGSRRRPTTSNVRLPEGRKARAEIIFDALSHGYSLYQAAREAKCCYRTAWRLVNASRTGAVKGNVDVKLIIQQMRERFDSDRRMLYKRQEQLLDAEFKEGVIRKEVSDQIIGIANAKTQINKAEISLLIAVGYLTEVAAAAVNAETLARAKTMSTEAIQAEQTDRIRMLLERGGVAMLIETGK